MADPQGFTEIGETTAVQRHQCDEQLPAPAVGHLDAGGEQLVPLGPAREVLTPDRRLRRESGDQRQQAPRRFTDDIPEIETVIALEVGLDKVPTRL